MLVADLFGKMITLTLERTEHILSIHPEFIEWHELVEEILQKPCLVKRSKKDRKTLLFYKKQDNNYIVIVVKYLNGEGFILTSYKSKNIKEGEIIWIKN